MRRSLSRALTPAVAVGASLAFAACGGSSSGNTNNNGGGSSASNTTASTQSTGGQKGGTLQMLWAGDVDHIDPGEAYYQVSFMVDYATQRPLFSYPPNSIQAVPDLAAQAAKISNGGKTVTIKIRPGVKFSPPVNREVTSSDVKYAIERGFLPSVANGYAPVYMSDIKGVSTFEKEKTQDVATLQKDITGIQTPDKYTIVFHLTRGTGAVLVGALSLPLSAPVPESYAKPFDSQKTSSYGMHQVATGPYMIKNDAKGNVTGYDAGKAITLVRNPSWNGAATGDYRKAYVNEIDVQEGNQNTEAAAQKILQGSHLIAGDFPPPPTVLKTALQTNANQIVKVPSGGIRYISLNTTIPPLNNINVRKAIIAASDRVALRQTRGGPYVGSIAQHYIPPNLAGFQQSGGYKGFTGSAFDFMQHPSGDMKLAQQYMKKAGYPSGKYTGNQTLLMVGDNSDPGDKTAQVSLQQIRALGFKINFKSVTHDTMYTKYCNTPASKTAICPNVGWLKDFPDPQTMLDATFNGKDILPSNNSNWPQLNDPKVNAAMAKAELLTDPGQRAQAWANINKMIVADAVTIPWVWDNDILFASKDVNMVVNKANAEPDLTFTSLK